MASNNYLGLSPADAATIMDGANKGATALSNSIALADATRNNLLNATVTDGADAATEKAFNSIKDFYSKEFANQLKTYQAEQEAIYRNNTSQIQAYNALSNDAYRTAQIEKPSYINQKAYGLPSSRGGSSSSTKSGASNQQVMDYAVAVVNQNPFNPVTKSKLYQRQEWDDYVNDTVRKVVQVVPTVDVKAVEKYINSTKPAKLKKDDGLFMSFVKEAVNILVSAVGGAGELVTSVGTLIGSGAHAIGEVTGADVIKDVGGFVTEQSAKGAEQWQELVTKAKSEAAEERIRYHDNDYIALKLKREGKNFNDLTEDEQEYLKMEAFWENASVSGLLEGTASLIGGVGVVGAGTKVAAKGAAKTLPKLQKGKKAAETLTSPAFVEKVSKSAGKIASSNATKGAVVGSLFAGSNINAGINAVKNTDAKTIAEASNNAGDYDAFRNMVSSNPTRMNELRKKYATNEYTSMPVLQYMEKMGVADASEYTLLAQEAYNKAPANMRALARKAVEQTIKSNPAAVERDLSLLLPQQTLQDLASIEDAPTRLNMLKQLYTGAVLMRDASNNDAAIQEAFKQEVVVPRVVGNDREFLTQLALNAATGAISPLPRMFLPKGAGAATANGVATSISEFNNALLNASNKKSSAIAMSLFGATPVHTLTGAITKGAATGALFNAVPEIETQRFISSQTGLPMDRTSIMAAAGTGALAGTVAGVAQRGNEIRQANEGLFNMTTPPVTPDTPTQGDTQAVSRETQTAVDTQATPDAVDTPATMGEPFDLSKALDNEYELSGGYTNTDLISEWVSSHITDEEAQRAMERIMRNKGVVLRKFEQKDVKQLQDNIKKADTVELPQQVEEQLDDLVFTTKEQGIGKLLHDQYSVLRNSDSTAEDIAGALKVIEETVDRFANIENTDVTTYANVISLLHSDVDITPAIIERLTTAKNSNAINKAVNDAKRSDAIVKTNNSVTTDGDIPALTAEQIALLYKDNVLTVAVQRALDGSIYDAEQVIEESRIPQRDKETLNRYISRAFNTKSVDIDLKDGTKGLSSSVASVLSNVKKAFVDEKYIDAIDDTVKGIADIAKNKDNVPTAKRVFNSGNTKALEYALNRLVADYAGTDNERKVKGIRDTFDSLKEQLAAEPTTTPKKATKKTLPTKEETTPEPVVEKAKPTPKKATKKTLPTKEETTPEPVVEKAKPTTKKATKKTLPTKEETTPEPVVEKAKPTPKKATKKTLPTKEETTPEPTIKKADKDILSLASSLLPTEVDIQNALDVNGLLEQTQLFATYATSFMQRLIDRNLSPSEHKVAVTVVEFYDSIIEAMGRDTDTRTKEFTDMYSALNNLAKKLSENPPPDEPKASVPKSKKEVAKDSNTTKKGLPKKSTTDTAGNRSETASNANEVPTDPIAVLTDYHKRLSALAEKATQLKQQLNEHEETRERELNAGREKEYFKKVSELRDAYVKASNKVSELANDNPIKGMPDEVLTDEMRELKAVQTALIVNPDNPLTNKGMLAYYQSHITKPIPEAFIIRNDIVDAVESAGEHLIAIQGRHQYMTVQGEKIRDGYRLPDLVPYFYKKDPKKALDFLYHARRLYATTYTKPLQGATKKPRLDALKVFINARKFLHSLSDELMNGIVASQSSVSDKPISQSKSVKDDAQPALESKQTNIPDNLVVGANIKTEPRLKAKHQAGDTTLLEVVSRKWNAKFQDLSTLHDLLVHAAHDGEGKVEISESEYRQIVGDNKMKVVYDTRSQSFALVTPDATFDGATINNLHETGTFAVIRMPYNFLGKEAQEYLNQLRQTYDLWGGVKDKEQQEQTRLSLGIGKKDTPEYKAQLHNAVVKAVGKDNAALIKIVTADEARDTLPSLSALDIETLASIEGFTNGNNTYLIQSAFDNPDTAAFVAWHELAHRGIEVQGRKEWHALLNRIADENPLLQRIADSIHKRYEEALGAYSKENALEESIADLYAAYKTGDFKLFEERNGVTLPDSWKQQGEKNVIQRVVDAIADFFSRLFGRENLNDKEIRTLLRGLDGVQGYEFNPKTGALNGYRFSLASNNKAIARINANTVRKITERADFERLEEAFANNWEDGEIRPQHAKLFAMAKNSKTIKAFQAALKQIKSALRFSEIPHGKEELNTFSGFFDEVEVLQDLKQYSKEDLQAIADNANFQAWFKDAHKAFRNTDGTPKVFYRGMADIDQSDIQSLETNANSNDYDAEFYTDNAIQAETYFNQDGYIQQVAINAKKPFIVPHTKGKNFNNLMNGYSVSQATRLFKMAGFDTKPANWGSLKVFHNNIAKGKDTVTFYLQDSEKTGYELTVDKKLDDSAYRYANGITPMFIDVIAQDFFSTNFFVRNLQQRGKFDSVIFKDIEDTGLQYDGTNGSRPLGTVTAVWGTPDNQAYAKELGNKGTFSKEDNHIFYSLSPTKPLSEEDAYTSQAFLNYATNTGKKVLNKALDLLKEPDHTMVDKVTAYRQLPQFEKALLDIKDPSSTAMTSDDYYNAYQPSLTTKIVDNIAIVFTNSLRTLERSITSLATKDAPYAIKQAVNSTRYTLHRTATLADYYKKRLLEYGGMRDVADALSAAIQQGYSHNITAEKTKKLIGLYLNAHASMYMNEHIIARDTAFARDIEEAITTLIRSPLTDGVFLPANGSIKKVVRNILKKAHEADIISPKEEDAIRMLQSVYKGMQKKSISSYIKGYDLIGQQLVKDGLYTDTKTAYKSKEALQMALLEVPRTIKRHADDFRNKYNNPELPTDVQGYNYFAPLVSGSSKAMSEKIIQEFEKTVPKGVVSNAKKIRENLKHTTSNLFVNEILAGSHTSANHAALIVPDRKSGKVRFDAIVSVGKELREEFLKDTVDSSKLQALISQYTKLVESDYLPLYSTPQDNGFNNGGVAHMIASGLHKAEGGISVYAAPTNALASLLNKINNHSKSISYTAFGTSLEDLLQKTAKKGDDIATEKALFKIVSATDNDTENESVVSYFDRGVRKNIVFSDNVLANALRTYVDPVKFNVFDKTIGRLTKAQAYLMVNTPAFQTKQLFMDTVERLTALAGKDLSTENKVLSTSRISQNVLGLLTSDVWQVPKRLIAARLYAMHGDMATHKDPYIQKIISSIVELNRNGGFTEKTGELFRMNYDELQQLATNTYTGKKWNTIKRVFSHANNITELFSASLIYDAIKAEGVTASTAAGITLDTANYKKKGTLSPQLAAFYPFVQSAFMGGGNLMNVLFKTGVQDAPKNITDIVKPKGAKLFGAMLLGFLALNAMLAESSNTIELEDGEEVSEWWLNAPSDGRYIPMPIGDGNILRIPIAHGLTRFAMATATAITKSSLNPSLYDSGIKDAFVGGVVENVQPLQLPAYSFSEDPSSWILHTIIPQVLRPTYDIAANKNRWGNAIHNPFPSSNETFNHLKQQKNVAEGWIEAAKLLYQGSGGTLDVNPKDLKYFIDNTIGVGLGGYAVSPAMEDALISETLLGKINPVYDSGLEQRLTYLAKDLAQREKVLQKKANSGAELTQNEEIRLEKLKAYTSAMGKASRLYKEAYAHLDDGDSDGYEATLEDIALIRLNATLEYLSQE